MAQIGNRAPARPADENLEDGYRNGKRDPEWVNLAQPRLDHGEIDPAQPEVKQPDRDRHPGYKDQKSAHDGPSSLTFRLIQGISHQQHTGSN